MLTRRSLIASAGAFTAASYSRVLGANDRIHLGLIGAGGRGTSVMGTFQKNEAVRVTAVCDVFGDRRDRALSRAPEAKGFADHRKLLEVRELDAVLIATPDHWHAQTAIDAMNAGKDVYVEKPLTRTIEEGPEIIKAARVNNRICQVGMQQRSGQNYIEAKEKYIKSGRLGKVALARTWWHNNGPHEMRVPESMRQCPSNLDWARYLGPVKWRDWDARQYLSFRAFLDFGGGLVTDLFTHWVDVVHMFLDRDDPIAATASGGVYLYKDGRTAPDTIEISVEYPDDLTVTFDCTLAPGASGAAQEFLGTEGRLWISRSRYEFTPAGRNAQPEVVTTNRDQTLDHVENFLDCMRTRKLPNADVRIGHRGVIPSHLGNLAYLQKRRIKFDPVREEVLPL
jgi:predicted dehydrogenase